MRNRLPIVLSTAALVVAVLGATPVGHAAMNLVVPRNSVGTLQLKANAVTAAKVKNGSLLSADFKSGQLPQGPQGPAGPQGPPGMSGLQPIFTTGASNSTVTRTLSAACPAGKTAVGGGGSVVPANQAGVAITSSYLANATTWSVNAREVVATAGSWSINAFVVCATVTP